MAEYFLSSVTRISDLGETGFSVGPIDKSAWDLGHFVVGEVLSPPGRLSRVELPTGRLAKVLRGDQVVGSLGRRCATLEAVGDWREIGDDLVMHALTSAGLFGKCTSKSPFIPRLLRMTYRGHVLIDGGPVSMTDYVQQEQPRIFGTPVIMLIGTSMSAGKTTGGRVIIRLLKRWGLRVAAAKLTGAARFGEILGFRDAGADFVADFVDVGLSSTVCSRERFTKAAELLLTRIEANRCDVAVIEAGASPIEPYNGDIAMELTKGQVFFTVLSASDPYAAVGVTQAFGISADIVSGISCNTEAGRNLVASLTGLPALNLIDPESSPHLDRLLSHSLPPSVRARRSESLND